MLSGAPIQTDTTKWGDKLGGGGDDAIECSKKILFVVISRIIMATSYTFNRLSHIRNVHDHSDTILN